MHKTELKVGFRETINSYILSFKYNLSKIFFILLIGIALCAISTLIQADSELLKQAIKIILLTFSGTLSTVIIKFTIFNEATK